jgi:hypothetical protein
MSNCTGCRSLLPFLLSPSLLATLQFSAKGGEKSKSGKEGARDVYYRRRLALAHRTIPRHKVCVAQGCRIDNCQTGNFSFTIRIFS